MTDLTPATRRILEADQAYLASKLKTLRDKAPTKSAQTRRVETKRIAVNSYTGQVRTRKGKAT